MNWGDWETMTGIITKPQSHEKGPLPFFVSSCLCDSPLLTPSIRPALVADTP